MLDAALDYLDSGFAPIPLNFGQKTPVDSWRQYQDQAPSRSQVLVSFRHSRHNIGIICGRASGNLVVLDCDTEASFADVGARLASIGIVTWTVQRPPSGSKHDGGGHYWLRSPEAAVTCSHDGIDIRGQGSYILAPPSLHPDGGQYAFVVKPDQVFALPRMDSLDWLPAFRPCPPQPRIPRLAWHLLQGDQKAVGRYPSRSEAEAALCASLICAGFEFTDLLNLLNQFPGPGKYAELRTEDPQAAFRYLERTWQNALAYVASHESEAILLARELRPWAESRAWPGRTGATDRAVYLAHLTIVERCGKQPHGASCRELAELAGVSRETAAKACHRLEDAGLLTLEKHSTTSLSNLYRLVPPEEAEMEECASPDTPSITPTVMECQVMHSHDAFRWSGLGKTGAHVFAELQKRGTASVEELAEATGRHRTTVQRKLNTMRLLGLVKPKGDGRWSFVGGDLDDAAQELGTAGIGERQREKHERQRALHRWELEHGRRGA